jgi:hypothetical protein
VQSKNNQIDFREIQLEFIIPLLAGVLCSLFLCAFISSKFNMYTVPKVLRSIESIEEDSSSFLFSVNEDTQDSLLEYYGNFEYRDWVIGFFTGICSDREVAQAILDNSEIFKVSPALAFALSWEESRFNPWAINRYNRNGSIDRGLFQLNNKSFPNLDIAAFFDVNSNAYYGIGHLRHCLNTGGSEISALAMYNAGTNRVRTTGAPEVTLNYISRILNNKSKIESRFHSRLIKEEERRMEEKTERASQLYFGRN